MSDVLSADLPDPALRVLVGSVALSFFLAKTETERKAVVAAMLWAAARMEGDPSEWPLDFGGPPEDLPRLIEAAGLTAPWLRRLADQFAVIAPR